MAKDDTLKTYRAKRDLPRSREPKGGHRRSRKRPIFVIQKHAASSLHYDLRLEAGGVLRSWAVPKGPSTDPGEKRLAMPVEDHPLDYAGFEGVIPEGRYGAGTVIVWDTGHYRPLSDEPVEQALEQGHVAVWLEGSKLHGGYALTRVSKGKRERWLLVKMDDEGADRRRDPLSSQPKSALSGRTTEELAAQASREDEP